jgi:DNA-binding CsgD family transcriptional regulator
MEKQTLQKLIEQGYSQRRMAQVLSISVRRVKKILFDFGLTTK